MTSTETKKPNPGFMKPMTPSKELAAIVGHDAMPRTAVVGKVWDYIKKHNLQDVADTYRRPTTALSPTYSQADRRLTASFGQYHNETSVVSAWTIRGQIEREPGLSHDI